MAAGKANMVDVVTAVAETEVAIEALVVGARQGDRGLRRNHEDADLIGARAGGETGEQMTGPEVLDVARDAIITLVLVASAADAGRAWRSASSSRCSRR